MTVTQSGRLGDNRIGAAAPADKGGAASTSPYLPTVALSFSEVVDVTLMFEDSGT